MFSFGRGAWNCRLTLSSGQGNVRKPRSNEGLNRAVLSERALRSIPRQPQPNVKFTK